MSKGSYPVVNRRGECVGHQVYVAGKGWVYRPLPEQFVWTVVAPRDSQLGSDGGAV